ncbi:5'/3'-nucleotidase SurE [Thalassoroseus pseudoceratinae]|uniref:5'/3'-nucleotidase SurE n=1 Tax=Thalassoroseus pseudoceratinae TaxID=2713176 RepID=UPI0014242F2D|nr:5'/3'-nucleotidase SurE [Thalassoroseus pseudoceratinae]
MKILLVNDDGIHAPGLHALHDALCELGEVTVVAPALEQSGVGLSITYLHPLMVHKEQRDGEHFGWAVHGSPADCVKLGMLEFCENPPDLVVSGINSGSNVGINVLYSGTVAGAIEGAFFGVTSVAVSLSMETLPDYPRAAKIAGNLIRDLLATDPPTGSLWNLNLPKTTPEGPKGVKVVRMGVKRIDDTIEKRLDPRGRPYYWSGLDPARNHAQIPETDNYEVSKGFVTLTPLHFDLSETTLMEQAAKISWSIDSET